MDNPILVTGTHNSGSTWVGVMIALSPLIGYMHVPFNPNIGVCRSVFDYWFTYVCDENESIYYKALTNCLNFKYPLFKDIKTISSPKDIARISRDKLFSLGISCNSGGR